MRFTAIGFELRCAADGVEALEHVEDWTPDVAICDVMMPRLSGLSVVRELRARGATAHVPVVLLTARCFDEDIQDVMNLGGVSYVPKPFDFHQLVEMIQELARPPALAEGPQP